MIRTKMWRVAVPALLSATLLASCSGFTNADPDTGDAPEEATPDTGSTETGDGGGETEPADVSGKTVELMSWASPEQKALLDETFAKFTEESGVTVEIITVPGGDYHQKINSLVLSETLPDLFWCTNTSNTFKPLAVNDQLFDFTDYLNGKDPDHVLDLAKFGSGYLDLFTHEGGNYAIPTEVNTNGVYYNQRLFEEAGVPLPTQDWTWDDFFDAAEKLTVKDGDKVTRYGLQAGLLDLYTPQGISMYSVSQGGEPYPDADSAVTWTDIQSVEPSPEFIEGAKRFQEAIKNGSITGPDFSTANTTAAFINGDVPMMYAGQWFTSFFAQDPKDPFGFNPMPSGSNGSVAILQGNGLCAPKNVESPDAAWQAAQYLLETGFNEAYAKIGITPIAYLPGSEGFFEFMASKENPGYESVVEAVRFDLEAENKSATGFLDPWGAKSENLLKTIWNPMLNGDREVEESVQEFTDGINGLIKTG